MMYGNKLAAAIKVNGKVLREFKDTVHIPFGSEYAITIRNLHTTRAVVSVYIDGDNVVPGGLVLNAGQSIDLERSIRNNNLTEGNRFKFIERTSTIEDHRGIGVEDGLVRIEYQFEQPRPILHIPTWTTTTTTTWPAQPWYSTNNTVSGVTGSTGDRFSVTASGAVSQMNVGGVLRGVDHSKGEATKAAATAAINQVAPQSSAVHDGSATMDWNDTGITVPGSKSTQSFQTTTVGILESATHNLIFKIVGDLGHNKPVSKPVTVKHKPKCQTCGKQNKAHAKFCVECGTALEIFA